MPFPQDLVTRTIHRICIPLIIIVLITIVTAENRRGCQPACRAGYICDRDGQNRQCVLSKLVITFIIVIVVLTIVVLPLTVVAICFCGCAAWRPERLKVFIAKTAEKRKRNKNKNHHMKVISTHEVDQHANNAVSPATTPPATPSATQDDNLMPVITVKSLVSLIGLGTKSVDRALSTRKSNKLRNKFRNRVGDGKNKNSMADAPVLPDNVWNTICDNLNPFDQMRLRRVNKQLHDVVEERLQSQIYLDVVKCDLLDVMREDEQNGGPNYHPHRRHNLLLNISDRSITLFVADHWTARDVSCLFRSIQFFGKFARCITIDAAIAELLVVGLSTMKLSRWHAFETYVQAVGPIVANELHMKITKSPPPVPAPLFPLATEITVRALTSDLAHLSRLPDYGVSVRRLFHEATLELLRINIVDSTSMSRYEVGSACRHIKRPHKHMNIFKKWVHAAELREKYVQQYS